MADALQTKLKMYAIVAGCHYNGLSIIQELGRHGVKCYGLDYVKSVGTWSKYAHYLYCPNPTHAESSFINFLLEFGSKQGCQGVIFPTNDEWALALSKFNNELRVHYQLVVPSYEAIQILLEKNKFFKWAQKFNYPVPRTCKLSDFQYFSDHSFPLICKPESRKISSNNRTSSNIQRYLDNNRFSLLKDRQDVFDLLIKHQKYSDYFILQEYVSGLSDLMFTVGIYADKKSSIRVIFTGRKVRGFPPDHGDCIVGQIEKVPDHILYLVKEICSQLKYVGIAEFEFKRDTASDKFYLIEINPRSWSWIGITPHCGVSIPLLAFRDMSGQYIPPITISSKRDGSIKYVKIFQDLENCLWRNSQAGCKQWSYSLKGWLVSLKSDSLVIAEFQKDDLLPFFYVFSLYIYTRALFLLRALKNRIIAIAKNKKC